ncbi:GPI-anchored protein LLG1 [Physcomitrium patens]|uniref:GPI-anchored protein LLG1-like domain-containing protein n=1 Tax=Physcomitrium patens TaxID=3218 RepID=A9TNH3_PHYPA|nr:GPI-anchored protein LLG1-like [Physcomitrium patens]PNR54856.1 hypothetical protein PHYPA_005749 [Physcomitrium patens]|eukprot:XP_024373183.1 GPI-anchored protein LLG1-like [Physcomitrella patens]
MALVFLSSSQMRCLLLIVASLCVVSAVRGDGGTEAGAILRGSPSRKLLQTVTVCPIDFSAQDYSAVTTVCESTRPNLTRCCDAFTTYACAYAEYINNPTTNCWRNLITYLTLAGNYPEQLFQSCMKTNLCIAPSPVPMPAHLVGPGGDP